MFKLEGTDEDVLIYGISKTVDSICLELIESGKVKDFRMLSRILGLNGKNSEKNLWTWRKKNVGIPIKALKRLSEISKKDLTMILEDAQVGRRRSKHKFSNPRFNEMKAYLAGIISGDGNLQEYFIQITDQYEENLKLTKDLFYREFGVPVSLRKITENKYVIEICSKLIVDYFADILKIQKHTKQNQKVPEIIQHGNEKIKIAYIRGWMDAEGNIEDWHRDKIHQYVRINFKIKDKNIVNWISEELMKNSITHNVRKDKEGMYRIQIASKKSVLRYYNKIGFTFPKKKSRLYLLLKGLGLVT